MGHYLSPQVGKRPIKDKTSSVCVASDKVFIRPESFELIVLMTDGVCGRRLQPAAPKAASRGNRLLMLAPSPGVSTPPLPGALPGCENVAARRFVSGSSTRTERLKTLPQAGQGQEEAVCSAHRVGQAPPPPLTTTLSVWRRRRDRG